MAANLQSYFPKYFLRLVALVTACLLLNGCLTRTREVQRRLSTAELQTATLAELVDRINHGAQEIKTLNATVDIDASTGGQKKGKITDYTEIHGYVLVREPDMLRVIGLVPVVRNRLFDMVSDGKMFKLLIPAKNKVIVGTNNITKPSSNELENIRPEVFFDSLLLHEIGPDEIPFLRVGVQQVRDVKTKKEVDQPNYIVSVLRKKQTNDGEWYISRSLFFDRTNLQLYKQEVFDQLGQKVTEADYAAFSTYDGILFPSVVDIKRPIEELEIKLIIDSLKVNKPISDEQLVLKIPPGTQVQNLDQENPSENRQAALPIESSTE